MNRKEQQQIQKNKEQQQDISSVRRQRFKDNYNQPRKKGKKEIFFEESKQDTFQQKVPAIARLCVNIIWKIAKYPNKKQLQEASLVDQILEMIKEFEQKQEQKNERTSMDINRLYGLFRDGVKINEAFNQQRIVDGISSQYLDSQIIVFNPTHTVTGQIIRQIVSKEISNYVISFGHQGIAKTFSYYLYKELSDMFLSQIIFSQTSKSHINQLYGKIHQQYLKNLNDNQRLKNKKKIKKFQIPKLFYWSMNNKISKTSQLMDFFICQCPQIQQEKNKNQFSSITDFVQLIKLICSQYLKKEIKVYLIVDQINQIASAFRQQLEKNVKCKDQLKEINELRCTLIKIRPGFTRVIYSSSMNIQNFYTPSSQKDQNLYQKLIEKLQLYPEQKHARTQNQKYRIFYPELLQFDSTTWSLVDMIIFELKKYGISLFQEQKIEPISKLRKKIFLEVKNRKKKIMITFLTIRQVIKVYIKQNQIVKLENKCLKQLIQIIQDKQMNQLKKNCASFNNNSLLRLERLKAISFVYKKFFEMSQQKQKQNLWSNFLPNMIFSEGKQVQNQLLRYLNKNLFVLLKSKGEIKYFLRQILDFTLQNAINWMQNKNIIIQIKNQHQKFFDKIVNQNYSSQIAVSLLPIEQLKEIFQPQIQNLSDQKQIKGLVAIIGKSARGSILQKQFIKYLITSETNFQNKECDLKYPFKLNQSQKIRQISMDKIMKALKTDQPLQNGLEVYLLTELPKIQKNINHQVDYQKFIKQFLKQTGNYLYIPNSQTSKSIDFALQTSLRPEENYILYMVYLCQVTITPQLSKLKEKMKTFCSAFEQVYKYFHLYDQNKHKCKNKLLINFLIMGTRNNKDEIVKVSKEMSHFQPLYYQQNSTKLQIKINNNLKWIDLCSLDLKFLQKHPTLRIILQKQKQLK